MSLTAQTTRIILSAAAVCFVIFASAGKAATQQEPKITGGSTVRGIVTYADTGRPLRTAKVGLLKNEGGHEQAISVTGYRGEFTMERIPAGRYLILIDAPGILKPEGIRTRESPIIPQFKLSDEQDLFTEVVVNGTDSVEVKVQAVRGGVITGRVVTDDDQPLPKADVKLLRKQNGKWLPAAVTWDRFPRQQKGWTTDPSGVYRIAGLAAGEYLVRVSEQLVNVDKETSGDGVYPNGSLMMTYYPSATSVEDAQPVTVVEGSESTGIDIRLPPLTPHAISGQVLGPDNEPGAGARIRVDRTDEVGFVDEDYAPAIYADSDGNWRIAGVPAGEYVISIGGPIEVSGKLRLVAPKRLTVRVANGDVVVPDVRLSTGAAMFGKITLDGKAPKMPYGVPLNLVSADVDRAAARGSARSRSAVRELLGLSHVMDPDGSFYMYSLPAGRFWLQPSTTMEAKFYLKAISRKGVDLMQKPIRLKDDTEFDDVVVTLATDFATIEGEITLPEGQAKTKIGDAIVLLAPATDLTRRSGGEFRMVQADAQGKFIFTCSPGEYYITALSPDHVKKLPAPIDDDYFKNDSKKFTRVKVRGGEKLKGVKISIG
ncbi:MAG TPA: carboxypeptidase-like regulatory domain-containing protein [Pyrinomonadaceae bacterium]|nr:carboxypeptidase-like regulatory domain-containing protein [Pyrinomonadaceae bacterium]